MGKPTARFMNVTPVMAKRWLDSGAKNRKVRSSRVTLYAEMMRRGEWLTTHQGIALDEADHLMDGQHRLMGIVESGVTVEMLVVEGLPMASSIVMDQGAMRAMYEQLSLTRREAVSTHHMAAAKAMMAGVKGFGHSKSAENIAAKDVQVVARYFTKHEKAVRFAVEMFMRDVRGGITIAAVMAPIARAWYQEDREQLADFARIVVTGLADKKDQSAVIILRNYLLTNRGKGIRADRVEVYRKTEQALRAFLDKEHWDKFPRKEIEDELFPVPGEARPAKPQSVAAAFAPRLVKSAKERASAVSMKS